MSEDRRNRSKSVAKGDLYSTDAQVRRRAAIRLGECGNAEAAGELLQVLQTESDSAAASSMVLALGSLGGDAVREGLTAHLARSDQEALALAKAMDRLGLSGGAGATWRTGLSLEAVRVEVTEGLERPVSRALDLQGFGATEVDRPGLLRLKKPVAVSRLQPPPRMTYNLRLLLGVAEAGDSDLAAMGRALEAAVQAQPWTAWIEDGSVLKYRFSVEGRKPDRRQMRDFLDLARAALAPCGLSDSPSGYNCELVMSWLAPHPTLYFRPRFRPDERFSYRVRDVSASISPVVAAALAQVAPLGLSGDIIDPTCGSGTLLFERGLLSPEARLFGIDVDAGAIAAATANAERAGLAGRLTLQQADARDPSPWRSCGLVLANLPFGIRSGREDRDLKGLYSDILTNAALVLHPSGRVILATANRSALEFALDAHKEFRTLARYRFSSGGIFVQLVVLGLS